MDDEVRQASKNDSNGGKFVYEVLVDGALKAQARVNKNDPPYRFTVDITGGKWLTLRVRNEADDPTYGDYYGWADWGNAQVASSLADIIAPDVVTQPQPTYVSDLPWESSSCGYGMTAQRDTNLNGDTLLINGAAYAKGIGTHVYAFLDMGADVTVDITGMGYTVFEADVGMDDDARMKIQDRTQHGHFIYQVLLDGNVVAETPVLTADSLTYHLTAPVAGGKKLTLRVKTAIADPFYGDWYGSADWGGAILKP